MGAQSRKALLSRTASEFAVIVVGVLVALAVNEWNQGRHDRAREAEYLRALLPELRRDSVVYADVLAPTMDRAAEALPEALAVASGAPLASADTLDFVRSVIASHGSISTFPVEGRTYEVLVATGDIGLIESTPLRSAIVNYYVLRSLANVISRDLRAEYPPLVRGFVPLKDGAALPDSALRSYDVTGLLRTTRTPAFRQAANRHTVYVQEASRLLRELQSDVASLIDAVETELEHL